MNKIIIIGGGVVLAIALAVILAWPKYQDLQNLKTNIKEKEALLQSQRNYYAKIKETDLQLQAYTEPMVKVASALPKDPSSAALASFLQENAAQTGVIFKKIVLGGTLPSKTQTAIQETQVIVQVTGSYKAFKDFLSAVEDSSRLIEVQSVSVETPLKTSKEPPLYTLNIRTYSY